MAAACRCGAGRGGGREGAMPLTVLLVGYSFAPISADPVGGSEQILSHLDRALVEGGHRSLVVAPEGSEVAGELFPVPAITGEIDDAARRHVEPFMQAQIAAALASHPVDLVHMHGLDFDHHLPPPGVPVMVTLHLPLEWYREGALAARPDTFLYPVSATQASSAPPGVQLMTPIHNGVRMSKVEARRRDFALMLGRICWEKGQDDALDAAALADMKMILAGIACAYPEHLQFMRDEVEPRLDRNRRWVGPVAGRAKERLLAQAACVVIPSRAPETSSLVAMEALAAGTPVVAYRAGALPEIVEHGRTGLLVEIGDVEELARAMREVAHIDRATCRQIARERFSLERMIDSYMARYAELAHGRAA